MSHIVFGSIAMLTCCLQIWPWLRARNLALHRGLGRVYVFAGVLPAGLLGFVVGVNTPFGPVVFNVASRNPDACRSYSLPRLR